MKRYYERKESSSLDEVLSNELICQFSTAIYMSKFLKRLHAQVLVNMLESTNGCLFGL